jgi:hypothetical protein
MSGNAYSVGGDFVAPTQKQEPITEDDIVYPGSSLVERDARSDAYWRHAYYRVNAGLEEVEAYYRTHFPEKGWVRSTNPHTLIFYRLEGRGDISWILALEVSFTTFENGDTGIHLSTGWSPDVTNIPLYPGALFVEKDGSVDTDQGVQPAVTTFLADAGPTEVEDYYKRGLLQEYYWKPNPSSGPIESASGLIFGHGDLGSYPVLVIHANRQPEGQTKVEIRLETVVGRYILK